jgi:hypothetical protein
MLSTPTQYLTWFDKPPTSTGEEPILLEIDREEITTHMEEEDHFHSQLSLLTHCCTRQQGCCLWQLLLSLSVSSLYTLSITFCSLSYASIYRHEWWDNLAINYGTNGDSTWVAPFCQWLVQLVWQYPPTTVRILTCKPDKTKGKGYYKMRNETHKNLCGSPNWLRPRASIEGFY